MQVLRYSTDLLSFLKEFKGSSLGLVPTMGGLHAGHLSLITLAKKQHPLVLTTIFVNPKQFNDLEDLTQYPRNLSADLNLLDQAGCDLVFCPSPEEMYPPGFNTQVSLNGITKHLEGASRPGHFDGVTTVVALLFNLIQPTAAYFGQKDAQQLAVIRKMVKDLRFPVEVVGCPTIRNQGGLALSSRNVRLSEEQREEALVLYQSLLWAETQVSAGKKDVLVLKSQMIRLIEKQPSVVVDYISFSDLESLGELDVIDRPLLISLAAFVGPVRLIDNLQIHLIP